MCLAASTSACRIAVVASTSTIVKVDQIVGRVAKEGLPTMGACPARCRISRRDELGRYFGRRAEGRVIEHSQIFFDGPAGRLCRQPLRTFDALLPVGIRSDQAGINRTGLAADQTFSDAALQNRLENAAQKIALAEAAVPILREC